MCHEVALEEATVPVTLRCFLSKSVARFLEISADLESGHCYIPELAPWLMEFKNQCEAFTGGNQDEHDDYVDCLMYAMKERGKVADRRMQKTVLGALRI